MMKPKKGYHKNSKPTIEIIVKPIKGHHRNSKPTIEITKYEIKKRASSK